MRVLIADDNRTFAEYLAALVTVCEHEVVATVTGGGLAAIQSYTRHRPDVVLLDVLMPRFNGFTVCQQLVSRDPAARVILMSGLVAGDYPNIASSRACGYLGKPILIADLRAALAQAGTLGWCGNAGTLLQKPTGTLSAEAIARAGKNSTVPPAKASGIARAA